MNKVINGTPRSDESSLCLTCRNAWHMKTVNMGEIIICRSVADMRITVPVVACATYDDRRLPDLKAMSEIAWEVKSRNRGAVGFGGARELKIEITPPQRNSDYGVPEQPATPTTQTTAVVKGRGWER